MKALNKMSYEELLHVAQEAEERVDHLGDELDLMHSNYNDLCAKYDWSRERAEKAERERDEVIAASQADWTRAWDNGHMVGCEETITKHMQQENALRAKHWREAAEALNSKYGRYDIMGWEGAEYIEELADTIEKGES